MRAAIASPTFNKSRLQLITLSLATRKTDFSSWHAQAPRCIPLVISTLLPWCLPKGSPITKKLFLLCSTVSYHPNIQTQTQASTKVRFKVGPLIHAAAGAGGSRPNGTGQRRQEPKHEAPEGHGDSFLKPRAEAASNGYRDRIWKAGDQTWGPPQKKNSMSGW